MNKVLKHIDEQMELLKKLGFNVITTCAFDDMLLANWMYRACQTHNIQYPPHIHIINCCRLWRNDEQCTYVIRIYAKDLPEEVVKELELLGYTLNEDVLIYERIEDV